MSEAKHTPGPWFVDVHVNVMCADGLVAFPGIAAGFDQRANARLIAAAPDLLDALKYARRFVNASEVDIAFIDAALAKATEAQ